MYDQVVSGFKFGQIEVAFKDFQKQRYITDILTINVNKVVVSDKVSCNNGKDWWYIVGIKWMEKLSCHYLLRH